MSDKLAIIATRVEPELREQLRAAAEADDRSISSLVRKTLRREYGHDDEDRQEPAEPDS